MELLVCVALIAGGLYWYERRRETAVPRDDAAQASEAARFASQQQSAALAAQQAAEAKAALDAANARIDALNRQLEDLQRANLLRNDAAAALARDEFERELARAREAATAAAGEAAKREARAAAERAALMEANDARARRLRALLPRQGTLEGELRTLTRTRDEARTAFYAAARLRLAIVNLWPGYKYAVGWELADSEGTSTRPFHTGGLRVVLMQSGEGQAVLSSRRLLPSSYPEVLLLTPQEAVWMRQLEDYSREGQALYDRWQTAERAIAEKRVELDAINRELAMSGTNSKLAVGDVSVIAAAKSPETKSERRITGLVFLASDKG